jgi:HEAT repeat protein
MTAADDQREQEIQEAIHLSQSENPRERSAAVERLGKFGAGLRQLQMATTDRNGYVRAAAAAALAHFPAEEVALYVGDLLFDPNPYVRSAAVRTLGEVGASEYAGEIADLATDGNPHIRAEVLRALGNLRAPEAITALVEALQDPNRKLRLDAARGLRRLTDPAALEAIEGVLMEALRQPRPDLPFINTLIQAIGSSGPAEEVGPLLVRLLQEAVGCRTVAARVLRPLRYEAARPSLERALTDRNPNLQQAALQALEELGAEPSLPAIRALLQAPETHERVQRAACQVLAHLGDREALPFLHEMASSANPFLRPRAIEGIALIDPLGSRALFIESLADNNVAVRMAAVEALAPYREVWEVRAALEQASQVEVTDRLRERLSEILSLEEDRGAEDAEVA